MYCGHSPDEIDDYALADVQLFLEALPQIAMTVHHGVIPDEY